MGGKKQKIPIKYIENKNSREVACSKRRPGLYSKASKLCLLSGAKIAILTTPVSSDSNVSFYSFGHSSVDSVVSAFLTNQRPRDDENVALQKELGFWWEDEKLAKSEDPKELSDAIDSISSLLHNLKASVENRRVYKDDLKKKKKKMDVVLHGTHQKLDQNETLKIKSCSASNGIHDDLLAGFEEFIKKSEEKSQIVAVPDNNMKMDIVSHGTHHQELDQNQTLKFQSSSTSIGIQDYLPASFEGVIKNSEEKDQIVAISDNNMKMDVVSLGTHRQELDQNQTLNLQSCAASIWNQDDLLAGFDEFIKNSEEKDQVGAIPDNNLKKNVVLHETHQELDQNQTLNLQSSSANQEFDQKQTLNLQSCSASNGIHDDSPAKFEGFVKNSEEEDQIVAISGNNNKNGSLGDLDVCNKELGLDEISAFETKNSEDISMDNVSTKCSDSDEVVEDGALMIHSDFNEDNLHLSDMDENQTIGSSDSNNNNALPENFDELNQDLALEQYYGFLMNCEDFSLDDISTNENMCFDYEYGGAMAIHTNFDDDNLHFSDYFTMS